MYVLRTRGPSPNDAANEGDRAEADGSGDENDMGRDIGEPDVALRRRVVHADAGANASQ